MNAQPEPSFKQLTLKIHALLRGRETPESLADFFGVDLRRLSIYPRFVRNHALKFLNSNFSSLKSAFPEATWKALCLEYFEKHPPADWRLWKLASAFPGFIRSHAGRDGVHSLHAELALFEWTELEAYFSPLTVPSPLDLKFPALNPTLTALHLQKTTLRFIKNSRSTSPPLENSWDGLPEEQEEQTVFVFRHPESLLACHLTASENHLFVFKIVHDGMDLDKAAEVSGQTKENIHLLLLNAFKAGMIVLPSAFSKD